MTAVRQLEYKTMRSILNNLVCAGSFTTLHVRNGTNRGQTPVVYGAREYFAKDSVVGSLEAIVGTFHAKHYFVAEAPDEYVGGLRADHFMLEVGHSEYCYLFSEESVYVLTANHKGARYSEVYVDPRTKNKEHTDGR